MQSDDESTPMATARSAQGAARPPPYYPPPDIDNPNYTLLDLPHTAVPLRVTWSKSAIVPGKLGIRKDIDIVPGLLQVRAKADWSVGTKQFIYGCSIRDTLFNGKVSMNIPARLIEYRKQFYLPNGTSLSIGAGTRYIGGGATAFSNDNFRPILGAQLLFGGFGAGSNTVFSGNGFNIKKRLPLNGLLKLAGVSFPLNVELETFSDIRIPQLTTRYSVQNDGMGLGGMGVGVANGSQPVQLHIGQVNAIIRL